MGDFALVWDCTDADMAVEDDDVLSDEGLRTAIILSIWLDAPADEGDELPTNSQDTRGWWGDALLAELNADEGDVIGSKLWLLDRAKESPDLAPRAKEYIEAALQWLIDDGVAESVIVEVELGSLIPTITVNRPKGDPLTFRFAHVWDGEFATDPILDPSPIPRNLTQWNAAPELANVQVPSHLWGDTEREPVARSFDIGGSVGNALERTVADGLAGYDTLHTACTLEAWCKLSSFPANQAILSRWFFPGQLQFFLNIDSTGRISLLRTSNGSTVIAVSTTSPVVSLLSGQWFHVAITFDATDLRFFLNGALVQAPTATGAAMFSTPTSDVLVGADDNLSVAWSDKIAIPRVWNTKRTDGEIAANYLLLNPTDATGLITGLVEDETDTSPEANDFTLVGTAAIDTEIPIGADIPDGIGAAPLDRQAGNVTRGAEWKGPAGGGCVEASSADSTVLATVSDANPGTNLFGQWWRGWNPAQDSGMAYVWAKRDTDGLSIAFDHDSEEIVFVANPIVGATVTVTLPITGAFYETAWDILAARIDATTVAVYAKRIGDGQIFEATGVCGAGDDFGPTTGFEFLRTDTGDTVAGMQWRAGAFWNNPATALGASDIAAIGELR